MKANGQFAAEAVEVKAFLNYEICFYLIVCTTDTLH